MNLLVSIIIPAYNSEKWIKATIQSALSQTWKRKEIIIINDGSTDNTLEIAKQYESSIVKVINQNNKGASASRNVGLKLAQGDFIQWLDADDILASDKIEKQLLKSEPDPLSRILYSSAWGIFYHRLKSCRISPNSLWNDLNAVEWLRFHLQVGYYMPNCSWLVSRKLTELAGAWDERLTYNDDGEYFSRIVASSNLIKFHPESMCYYRKGSLSSLSRSISYTDKAIKSLNLSINLTIDSLFSLSEDELSKKAAIASLNRILSILIDKKLFGEINSNRNRILLLGGEIAPSNKTKKFTLVEKIIGNHKANIIKTKLWHMQILVEKYFERFISLIKNDSI